MTNLTKTNPIGSVQHPIPEKPDTLLVSILRTKRAHKSAGDTNFRLWLHSEIKRLGYEPEVLVEGNVLCVVDAKSDTLFSCHIDTCHSVQESDGSFQELAYDPSFGHIVLAANQKSGCLGADDGVGVYIMLKMIEAKVPGQYVFHTGEERGCIGSRALLEKKRDWLDQFSRAIAFDRPHEHEVIVAQGHACASVECGQAIADELNLRGLAYEVSHKGVVTDTKMYAGVIPECINLGVGYERQHTQNEYLNVAHAEALLSAALDIDWDSLPTVRKPVVPQAAPKSDLWSDWDGAWEAPKAKQTQTKSKTTTKSIQQVKPTPKPIYDDILHEIEAYGYAGVLDWLESTPEEAAVEFIRLAMRCKAAESNVKFLENFIGV